MTARLGLIGAGLWGRNYIRTLATFPTASLTRLASRNPEAGSWVGPACEISSDWRDLIAAKDLDGVIIATPPSCHAEMLGAALRRGLPALVEKPLTLDRDQALALKRQAEENPAFVLVDHIYLFHPGYETLRARLKGRGPFSIESEGGNLGPYRPDAGPLWDYGPHDVALCLDLVGLPPAKVSARRAPKLPDIQGENIEISLDFSDGSHARLTVGNAWPAKRRRFTAKGDGQEYVFDDLDETKLRFHDGEQGSQAVAVSPDLPLNRCLNRFIEGLRSGSRDLSSLSLGVEVVDCLHRCESSLKQR
ncbi:MAG: Gfo/Idh/MocA family oxidoreductase [Elusimicrobia bacterium]|nr:Gfo/Idh/MocA family oxidoreductase [Elusimicrobiota bacterium]